MASFINLISDILSIELTLGSLNFTVGGIALGAILIKAGVEFFYKLTGVNPSYEDVYTQQNYGMTKHESADYHHYVDNWKKPRK